MYTGYRRSRRGLVMSRELFRHRLGRVQIHPNDLKWMPVWLDEYARPQIPTDGQLLVVHAESALAFLRGLRDRGVPAWQRLQAVRREPAGPAGCASGGVGDRVSCYR